MNNPISNPGTTVSLVDDHSLLRGTLASLIDSFDGYSVLFEADNGKDFIQKLKTSGNPDIIILDVTMPEMNGFETAEWIRVNIPDARILVLSMMDKENDIIRMVKLGARGYLLKDSKPAVLRKALDEVRKNGFFMNELVSNKMLHYVTSEEQAINNNEIPQLTDKEITFVKLACSEMTYKEIAKIMELSQRTVEGYRDELFKKLNLASRVGLVLYAIKHGIFKI